MLVSNQRPLPCESGACSFVNARRCTKLPSLCRFCGITRPPKFAEVRPGCRQNCRQAAAGLFPSCCVESVLFRNPDVG